MAIITYAHEQKYPGRKKEKSTFGFQTVIRYI